MPDTINALARIASKAAALIKETNALEMESPGEAHAALHSSALHIQSVAMYQLGERAGLIVDHEATGDHGRVLMDGEANEIDIRNAVILAKDRERKGK